MAKRKKKDQVFKESTMTNINQEEEIKKYNESLTDSKNKKSS